jgi:hypothetical protein
MKKFLTSVIAGASVIFTPGSAIAGNTYEDHVDLFNALNEVGIITSINSKLHCRSGVDGKYNTRSGMLIVCQDNGVPGGPQVTWTLNDLDTLRHESHHVVQDCNEGTIADGLTDNLFYEEQELIEFISKSSLTTEQLKNLMESLKNDGLSYTSIMIEVEAYIVAKDVDASTIASKVREFCTL